VRVEKDRAVNEVSFVSGRSDHHIVKLDHAGQAGEPVALDVLFLIDATGSMEDEINQLKANVLQISAQVDALPARPDVRFAMVTYRDRGDAYVTRVHEFTPDVRLFQAELEKVRARGGGDYPESLNEALHRAIGLDDQGEYIYRQLAQFTLGRFVFLTYEEAGQPSSGPGTETDHHVAPQDYTVDALDSLVVRLVTEELAALSDQGIRYWEQ
jgi:hypothetical protein